MWISFFLFENVVDGIISEKMINLGKAYGSI